MPSIKTTCTKPDRDVPMLVCGHPMPCPHHTIVIDASVNPVDEHTDFDKLARELANIRWLTGRVHINTYFMITPATSEVASVIRIVTRMTWSRSRDMVGLDTNEIVAELPLHASIVEIRNATEEQQIQSRAWLEEHFATPVAPVREDEVRRANNVASEQARAEGIQPPHYFSDEVGPLETKRDISSATKWKRRKR